MDGGIRDIVVEMYRHGLVLFGEFKLTSGRISPYYIDLRKLPSYPSLYRRVMELVLDSLKEIEYDVVAGVETAGLIHASYLSCLTGKPMAYIRKKPKQHGTQSLVEGVVEGKKVLLVDDVATTGGTLEHGVKALRQCGGVVSHAYVIVNRCEGARQRLASYGVELRWLLSVTDIVSELKVMGLLDYKAIESLERYFREVGVEC